MKYLIDTCVISELAKKKPEQRVTAWISSIEESKLFLSVLTITNGLAVATRNIADMEASGAVLINPWSA